MKFNQLLFALSLTACQPDFLQEGIYKTEILWTRDDFTSMMGGEYSLEGSKEIQFWKISRSDDIYTVNIFHEKIHGRLHGDILKISKGDKGSCTTHFSANIDAESDTQFFGSEHLEFYIGSCEKEMPLNGFYLITQGSFSGEKISDN